jgi:RNA polymerase sigma factor (TIGR02999 family)
MADEPGKSAGPEMQAATELLPVVYAELRRLAASMASRLPPGQTLQPTALVHEAYLRLVGDKDPGWNGRRHFFGAAARAMRDILVDQARRKGARKHGGGARRVELNEGLAVIEPPADDLLAVDDAIQALQAEKPHLAEIASLRYFAGLSADETAAILGISASTLAREWRFARAWLSRRLGDAPMRAGKVDE